VTNRLNAVAALLAALAITATRPAAQSASGAGVLDQILDLYVRDGEVYYRALRQERPPLDRYVESLSSASIGGAPRNEQIAFWINAYNALVLRTVIDHYPIAGRSPDYPPQSVRQVPGAFERLTHRVAGRAVTLDEIEQTILPPFGDPRVFLALGRGAVGSGRLRSEAYTAARLDQQLSQVAAECLTRSQCVQVDRLANRVLVSSIFSWRRAEFSAAYADRAEAVFGTRSPIERAVLAFVSPGLLPAERELVASNTFEVHYLRFDWSLNDLTGR
jgi:hypothetical protein